MPTNRERFLALAESRIGSPYLWNAKGDVVSKSPELRAFDCSGFVTWLLHQVGGPDWRATHSSKVLFEVLPRIDVPLPGDLAFYTDLSGRIEHVMIVRSDGAVIGACGGGRSTTTLKIAADKGARVQVRRKGPQYRTGFAGFRRLPLDPT
jgi:murein DD-endopeptidase